MRDFLHPMVPVAVHQAFRRIGFRLVEGGIGVGRAFHRAVHGAHIHYLRAVRGKGEFADPPFHTTDLHGLAEFLPEQLGLVELTSLKVIDMLPVRGESGIGNTLGTLCKLGLPSAVNVAQEEIPHGAVLRNGLIGNAVEDGLPVRRQLRIRQASQ